MKVQVIDSIMGSGKSTYILDHIKNNSDYNYIYISPYLSEVGDVKEDINGRVRDTMIEGDIILKRFSRPTSKGKGKYNDVKKLLSEDANICATHSLFSYFDEEAEGLLSRGNYHLIIDENFEAIKTYDGISQNDLTHLLYHKVVEVQDSVLRWVEVLPAYDSKDFKYYEFKRLCDMGCLFMYGSKLLMWEFPVSVIKACKKVWISTYLFEGSLMRNWMELYDIEYEYMPPEQLNILPESFIKKRIKENLVLLDNTSTFNNNFKEFNTFSSSWYKRADDKQLSKVKYYIENIVKDHGEVGKVFWTTFKDYESKLKGKRYSRKPKDGLSPFVACNIRATNEYRDMELAVYTVNVYKKPTEVNYLKHRGSMFDQDTYALSEMLQWIWRGCIRQGKPMKVAILSNRMRELLINWLNDT